MALYLQPTVSAIAQSSGTAASLTTGAITTTSGNLIVVCVFSYDSNIGAAPVSDNKSNTYTHVIASFGTTQGFGAMFFCPNATGGASHTFTFTPSSNDFLSMGVLVIPNIKLTTPTWDFAVSSVDTATHATAAISVGTANPGVFVGAGALSFTDEGSPYLTSTYWSLVGRLAASGTQEGIIMAYRVADTSTSDAFTYSAAQTHNETIMTASFVGQAQPTGSSGGASIFGG